MRRVPYLGPIRQAAKRPLTRVRAFRHQALLAGRGVLLRQPVGLRRMVLQPIRAVAVLAVARPGDHPIAAPVLIGVDLVMQRHDEAATVGERVRDGSSPSTIVRAARIASAFERPRLADRLLDAVPESFDTTDPSVAGLRGGVDVALGRLREAMRHYELAVAGQPGRAIWRERRDRVRGQLSLLDPAWRPTLGAVEALPVSRRKQGRVLHLLNSSQPHRLVGYTVRAQQVARCQQAVGLDPYMVTRAGFPSNDGIARAPARDDVDGVPYLRIEPDLSRDTPVDVAATVTATSLARLVAELRPAVLHPATDYPNAQVALAVGERTGLPVVYEVRGFLEETWRARVGIDGDGVDRYDLAKAVETACMRRADAIVTLSETMRADIIARGGIDPDAVAVIPNGVDVDRFLPGPRDPDVAHHLGLRPGEVVVGYISSFTGYEGIAYLIKAVAILRRQGRPVRLLLVGDGQEREALEATAAAEGLIRDRGVIFTGRVPHAQIERMYRAIDVFVVPRTNARVAQLVTPLKPYEAMAMAKAVIVSDVPALREIIDDGLTGRTFIAEDAEDLAVTIDGLLDDPQERARLGANARAWVAQNRTWAANPNRGRSEFTDNADIPPGRTF